MTNEQIKEAMSRHFVCSIAHIHGVKCLTPEPDNGVDVTFCPVLKIVRNGQTRFLDSGNKLDVQIKSTTTVSPKITWNANDIKFALEAKTYNDLVYRRSDPLPLHLVLVIFDADPPACLSVRNAELALLGKAYWYLPDPTETETQNTSTITISIPLTNQLDVGFVPKIYTNAGYII